MHNKGDLVQSWSNIGWLGARITKAYEDQTSRPPCAPGRHAGRSEYTRRTRLSLEMHNKGYLVQSWSNIVWLDARITKAYEDHTYWPPCAPGRHASPSEYTPRTPLSRNMPHK